MSNVSLIDRLRAIDLAILDRVYTPIAHWAHDEFGWRAYQIGRACIGGMVVAMALTLNSATWFDKSTAALSIAAIIYSEWFNEVPHRIGFMNYRRYGEQFIRIAWLGLMLFALPAKNQIPLLLWGLSATSCLYFCAVTDRPRRPKREQRAAFAGGAA